MQRRSLLPKSKGAPDAIISCSAIMGELIPTFHHIFRLLLFFLKFIAPEEGGGGSYELCFLLTAPVLETWRAFQFARLLVKASDLRYTIEPQFTLVMEAIAGNVWAGFSLPLKGVCSVCAPAWLVGPLHFSKC